MIKHCPTCNRDLEEADFSPSHWRVNGKQCRQCHVNRLRKRELMNRYGLTPDDVTAMQARQRDRCLGCNLPLPINYVIDHNHETQEVRGLLCRPCNLVLGLVKEDKARLTRLRMYLDRDPSVESIYIVGSLRNPNVPVVGNKLRALGYDVYDDWFAGGPEADDYWQKYEKGRGRSFEEALRGRAAGNIFYFDKAVLDLVDIAVMVMPAGKSGHLELGYVAAQGKRTAILLDKEPERYEVMPQFANIVTPSFDEVVTFLKESK